jgi:hypothetical protein
MSVNVTNILFIPPPTEIRHPGKKSELAPLQPLAEWHVVKVFGIFFSSCGKL